MLVPLEKPSFDVRVASVEVTNATLHRYFGNDGKKLIKDFCLAHYNSYTKCLDDAAELYNTCKTKKEAYDKFIKYPVPQPNKKRVEMMDLCRDEINDTATAPRWKQQIAILWDTLHECDEAYRYVRDGIHNGMGKGDMVAYKMAIRELNQFKQQIDKIQ